MTKHLKRQTTNDADLRSNPLIGGSKGTTIAGVTPDELEESEGENTMEGDTGNDTNPQGGIDKPAQPDPLTRPKAPTKPPARR